MINLFLFVNIVTDEILKEKKATLEINVLWKTNKQKIEREETENRSLIKNFTLIYKYCSHLRFSMF